jgi:prepilin-type processing-associated H-X9-DG protein
VYHRFRFSRSGISLAEILIVIAVLCILASILLPVLMRAKGQSRATKCASNLKQLSNAFNLYTSDWYGVYPAPGGLKGDLNYWAQSGNGGLVSYIRKNGGIGTVWCCPEQNKWNGCYPARTYSMNSYLRETPDIEYPTCIGIIRGCPENYIEDKGRTILLYEGVPVTAKPPWAGDLDYIYRCGNWTCVRGWFPANQPKPNTDLSWLSWHGEKNNYLYCDGHIRSFKPNRYPNHPPYNYTNEWWVRKSLMAEKYKGWQ